MADISVRKYAVKKKNLFLIDIEGIPPFIIQTAARPNFSFEEIEIPVYNGRFYLPGKIGYEPIELTINDAISVDVLTPLMEWCKQVYDPDTGEMGYPEEYERNIMLTVLGWKGEELEVWEIKNAWVQSFNGGDLDQGASEPIQISLTIRYDQARLIRSGGTNTTTGTGAEIIV